MLSKLSNTKLINKWKPILEHKAFDTIENSYKKAVTARLLENYTKDAQQYRVLTEAPTNSVSAGGVQNYDPVLISLLRRTMPNLIAYDICGVQPMDGPTGLVFALRSRYQTPSGREALFNEAETGFSALGGTYDFTANTAAPPNVEPQLGQNPSVLNDSPVGAYEVATGMATATAEALGESGAAFREMAFSIERVSVTAQSRALKASYSIELAQDLKAIHGLDAEGELANILAAEILAEINREIVRTLYRIAVPGAQNNVGTAGTFNLDTDANGRWLVEKFKGLMFQIERDANAIAQTTRRGKGNLLIVSADVGSALAQAGYLDYQSALEKNKLTIDDTGPSYAGILNGQFKVYVDPYAANVSNNHFYVVGYKGSAVQDAGAYYCPYVPLQMMKTVDQSTFQPLLGFKTRYGFIQNPFAIPLVNGVPVAGTDLQNAVANRTANSNLYYRRVKITNLL